MPRGIYKRTKKFYRRPRITVKKILAAVEKKIEIEQVSVLLTRSHGEPGSWTTVCDLRDGTLFRFDYDINNIYRKMETVTNNVGTIENVHIRREAFRMDGVWLACSSDHLENCNYLATVQVCRILLSVDPPELGERP
jgi:hypothetical protein